MQSSLVADDGSFKDPALLQLRLLEAGARHGWIGGLRELFLLEPASG